MCKTQRLTILVAWLLGGLLLLLCPGCGSIRVARNAVSSTELETGNLEVQQTIVEFFPPVDTTPETPPDCRNPTEDAAPAIGAVKRVVRTELSAKREQAVVVDSSSVSGKQMEENSEENTEKHSEVNEPPSATKLNVTLKALAVLLALLIICYGIIQYRINLYKK